MDITITKLTVPAVSRNGRIYTESGSNSTRSGGDGGNQGVIANHNRLHSVTDPLDHKPAEAADYGKVLGSNATTGAIEWAEVNVTPGGSTKQVQFNDAGAFAGEAGFEYDKTNKKLTAGVAGSISLQLAGRGKGQNAIATDEFMTLAQRTSVGLVVPAQFTVSGSPVSGSGTLTIAQSQQLKNVVFAGPASGLGAVPTFRALVLADVPSLATLYDKFESFRAGLTTNLKDIVGKYGAYVAGSNARNLLFKAGSGIVLTAANNATYEAQEITIEATNTSIQNEIEQVYLSSVFTVVKDAWRTVLSISVEEAGTYFVTFHVTVSKASNLVITVGARLFSGKDTLASVEHVSLIGNNQFSLSASGYITLAANGEVLTNLQLYSVGEDCSARPSTSQTGAARATQMTIIKIK